MLPKYALYLNLDFTVIAVNYLSGFPALLIIGLLIFLSYYVSENQLVGKYISTVM
jgi:hypothetical protein